MFLLPFYVFRIILFPLHKKKKEHQTTKVSPFLFTGLLPDTRLFLLPETTSQVLDLLVSTRHHTLSPSYVRECINQFPLPFSLLVSVCFLISKTRVVVLLYKDRAAVYKAQFPDKVLHYDIISVGVDPQMMPALLKCPIDAE